MRHREALRRGPAFLAPTRSTERDRDGGLSFGPERARGERLPVLGEDPQRRLVVAGARVSVRTAEETQLGSECLRRSLGLAGRGRLGRLGCLGRGRERGARCPL